MRRNHFAQVAFYMLQVISENENAQKNGFVVVGNFRVRANMFLGVHNR
jgi:hypothetical protein